MAIAVPFFEVDKILGSAIFVLGSCLRLIIVLCPSNHGGE